MCYSKEGSRQPCLDSPPVVCVYSCRHSCLCCLCGRRIKIETSRCPVCCRYEFLGIYSALFFFF
uniref:Uncharacterized protein n=1 Tax=Branchiostoma floridae TaxID=7739 RepID=C3Y8M5_BRAFL|eukprot:XP_002607452.1 hypothetical protein BRAFLDRAFT_204931 [Branchiostoma floridae]